MKNIVQGLFAGLLCVASAIGTPINTSGAPGAIVNTSEDLGLPGSPAADYGWTLSFISTLSPDDPNFFNLGALPGAFLMTGNTFYNFTGDPTYLILVFNTNSLTRASAASTSVQEAPEPGSFWLAGGMLLLSCCSVPAFRSRYN